MSYDYRHGSPCLLYTHLQVASQMADPSRLVSLIPVTTLITDSV
jgi:hypothetical protein